MNPHFSSERPAPAGPWTGGSMMENEKEGAGIMDEPKPMILNTSDEAAIYRTDIAGWVSRHNSYFGKDERLARWDGCTHTLCECGEPIEKPWTKCKTCRKAERDRRYAALEKKPWDGRTPLCIWDDDRYFWSEEELEEYCEDLDIKAETLRLVICEPDYALEIDPEDYYRDDLPDEKTLEEVDSGLADAFEELNKYIREAKVVLSWRLGQYAAVLEEK